MSEHDEKQPKKPKQGSGSGKKDHLSEGSKETRSAPNSQKVGKNSTNPVKDDRKGGGKSE